MMDTNWKNSKKTLSDYIAKGNNIYITDEGIKQRLENIDLLYELMHIYALCLVV